MSAGAILGFDTATADAVVAVTIGGQPVSERRAQPDGSGRPRHAAKLLAEIEAAAADAGGWEAIERLAVGIGPGTFTGLRIGVTTARALAQARSLPLVGVGSLEALGLGIARAGRGTKVPAADRRAPRRALRGARRRLRPTALGPVRRGARAAPATACRCRAATVGRGRRLATISSAARVRGRGCAPRRGPGTPDGGAARLRTGRGGHARAGDRGQTRLLETTRRRGMA